MKQKTGLGDCYALAKHKIKHRYPRYISPLALLTIMCLYAVKQVSAQQAEPAATALADIKPLQIGDTIPAYLWHLPLQVINHPEGKDTITLNDYRGKLILLDFWGPACSYCIAAFPKLDSLQTQFDTDFQVILITERKRDDIVSFHQRKPIPKHLFSTTADSVLTRFFYHNLLPHYAWINRQGRLIATTNGSPVTAANIELALNGEPIQAVQKYDLDFTRPFFLAKSETRLPLHYSLFRRGYYPGLNSPETKHTEDGIVRGKSFANHTYRELYQLVARPQFEAKGIRLTPNRWLLDTLDSLNWMSTQDAKQSHPNRVYSYELIVPPEEASTLDSLLLTTLNHYTGYSAAIRQIKVPCFVITSVSPKPLSLDEGRSQTLSQLVTRWNRSYMPNGKPFPILLDESGYAYPIPGDLRATDIQTLRSVLDSVGLNLIETTKLLDMFVITQH